MRAILRTDVFETNSSMVHCMQICTSDEYNKWVSGEYLLYDGYKANLIGGHIYNSGEFYPYKQVIEDIKSEITNKYEVDDYIGDYEFLSFETWGGGYYEIDSRKYTSPSGDELVICCYYGHD